MNPDIAAVFWKEWKEIVLARSAGGGGMRPLFVVLVIGVLVPLRIGPRAYFGPQPLLIITMVALASVAAVVADAFAGERERHTLETLLATRLPDQAILFGKMAACLAYGWGISLIAIILGLVTVNVANWSGKVLLYQDAASWLCLAFAPPLLGGVVASAGVLVSLRSATVRQAQQTLTLTIAALFVGLSFGAGALPDNVKRWFVEIATTWSGTALALAACAVVLFVNLALCAAAMARFQRSKMVLD